MSASSQAAPHEVRVGIYANEPKIFLGQGGQPTGILGDMLTEIARREDWTLIPVQCVWQECLQDLQSGSIDLLPDLAYSEQRAQVFDFHKVPALYSWSEIYHSKKTKINTMLDLQGKRVVVLADSVQERYLRELLNGFGVHAELIPVESLNAGFEQVATEKADAVVANHFFGDMNATRYQLVASPIMFQPAQLFFGTGRGKNTDLLKAIDRNLGAWRTQQDSPYFNILKKWIDQPPPHIGIPSWLWWGLGTLAFFLLAALLGGIFLRRQVLDKTRHLRASKEALKTSEARYRNLTENASDWIWTIDLGGKYLYSNSRVKALLGFEPDELLATRPLSLIHPDDQSAFSNTFEHAKDSRSGWHGVPIRWQSRNGAYLTLESSATPMFDAQHRLIGFQGVDRDITERIRSEATLRESEERLRLAQEAANQGWFDVDLTTGKVTVSANYARIIGYDPDEFHPDLKHWLEQVHPDDRQTLNATFLKYIKEGGPHTMEYRRQAKSGEWKWIRSVGKIVQWDAEQHPTRMIGIHTDVTERKLAEYALRKSEERLQLFFEHAPVALAMFDREMRYLAVSRRWLDNYSLDDQDIIGKSHYDIFPDISEKWKDAHRRGLAGEIIKVDEDRFERSDGNILWLHWEVLPWHSSEGAVGGIIIFTEDITQIKEHAQKLEYIAHYDALTGMPNRILLADRLHQAMAHIQRGERQLAVAYIDLDSFKAINDRHGHDMGDQFLAIVAARMKHALREGDTLARLGGDEFVAVLSDLADITASLPLLTRLLDAAAEPVLVNDFSLQVSASIGVTFYPQTEETDADQLLRQADQSMYQAKLAGKNRYHIFDTIHDRDVRIHHASLQHIRLALTAREFVLHYQPKVNMRTGAVIGAEALIRWQHPERGLLSPAMFLPVIEDHPLAIELGEWVIDTALTQMALWQAAGLNMSISVNVGALQLQQPDFVERLSTLLAAHPDINPARLELEVLETSALQDVARMSQVFNACRKTGVMFALDDFGTGYSSLTYLKRIPAHMLKIDQSFVRNMLDDPDDLAILEGILGLAIAFHREVIAEGVETVAHGVMLLQMGCELAQGYGIARPMPAENMQDWISHWKPDPSWSRPLAPEPD